MSTSKLPRHRPNVGFGPGFAGEVGAGQTAQQFTEGFKQRISLERNTSGIDRLNASLAAGVPPSLPERLRGFLSERESHARFGAGQTANSSSRARSEHHRCQSGRTVARYASICIRISRASSRRNPSAAVCARPLEYVRT